MQIHLIRHGEVANPSHIAYADIPGYRLSAKGREQATAAGRYLAARPVRRIIASPLDRATETAGLISTITGCVVVTDPRLTEWGLGVRWRGTTWPALPIVFPGELEAYLAHPQDLPFAPESLTEVADRMSAAIADGNDPGDEIAFVSHQDPIHVTRLRLTDSSLEDFHLDKPTHGSVVSLRREGDIWVETNRWEPAQ